MDTRGLLPIGLALITALCACGDGSRSEEGPTRSGIIPQDSTRFRNPIATQGNLPPPAGLTDQVSVPFVVGPATHDTADPWIVVHEGDYYLTYTSTPLRIRRSRTLGGLADAAEQILWPREGDEVPEGAAVNMWAPEIHRLKSPEDGRYHWYVYYSPGDVIAKSMAVLESEGDDPLGPYRYKAALPVNNRPQDLGQLIGIRGLAIDGTVFTNADGRLYYIYSAIAPNLLDASFYQQLWLAEMENPWTLKTEPIVISSPILPWERVGLPVNEGPVVLRHSGKIHVVYSASFCATDAYSLGRLTVAETDDLLDPRTWLTAKHPLPIFSSAPEHGIYGPGHNGFFKSPDGSEDWIVYHAHTAPGSFLTGGACGGVRTAHAQKFSFDAEGNPVLGKPVALTADLTAPGGDSTLNYQFEDAPIEDASRPLQSVVGGETLQGDRQLVGLRALRLAGMQPEDFIVFRLPVPVTGRYSLKIRAKTGPDGGAFTLAVKPAGHGAYTPLTLRGDSYAETAGITELDLGTVSMTAGDHLLRIGYAEPHPQSSGSDLRLDQIRMVMGDTP
jgi:GH43 family beta-xylosidase